MSCSSSESGSDEEVSSSTEYHPPATTAAKKDGSKKGRGDGRVTKKRASKAGASKPAPKPKKRKGKAVKEVVKLDIAKSKTNSKIPEFEVHIGREWYVKVSMYEGNERYYVCLRNFNGGKAGFGANLPIEMIDEIVKGFQLAQSHIQGCNDQ
jgi:hypothetical protein